MALKVELKPHERIIIGACVITNTDHRARLLIDGDNIPILREKDILTPETANTPSKLIYLAVQLMYISPDPQDNHGTYFNLLREVVTVMPSASEPAWRRSAAACSAASQSRSSSATRLPTVPLARRAGWSGVVASSRTVIAS